MAKPSGFKKIVSSFVLFVPFVVGYPAGRIATDVDTSIARLDTSIAVFRMIDREAVRQSIQNRIRKKLTRQ